MPCPNVVTPCYDHKPYLSERHRSATPACFWHPSLPSRRSARSADALGLAESACSAVGRGFSFLSSGIINRSALIDVMFISFDVRSQVDYPLIRSTAALCLLPQIPGSLRVSLTPHSPGFKPSTTPSLLVAPWAVNSKPNVADQLHLLASGTRACSSRRSARSAPGRTGVS